MCADDPCMNGGTCVTDNQDTSDFTCQCTDQYSGTSLQHVRYLGVWMSLSGAQRVVGGVAQSLKGRFLAEDGLIYGLHVTTF